MNRAGSPRTEPRPPSVSENKKLKTSEESCILGSGLRDLATHPSDLNKTHIPRPPKSGQNPALQAYAGKTQRPDEVRKGGREVGYRPVNLDSDRQPLDHTGSEGLRFDDNGMILPHSILGSVEDFTSFLEAKGETELVKRLSKSHRDPPTEAFERHHSEVVEESCGLSSGYRNTQSNALQHWHTHMTQRRRQQGYLSDLLDRPVEHLLMNQANHFRETQERREALNQVMPLIHSGYGYRAGSEFWSLPQHYGDEISGIAATLTQTEQGRREPVTYVAQPRSIRQETGIICAETLRPASRTWDQSMYLQRRWQGLRDIMDIEKPDIDGLEVIGSGKTSTFVQACRSPLLEEEEEEEEKELKKMKREDLDPPAQCEDVHSQPLLVPALRFCGQLARWTGNSTANQGEVGIHATVIFEALTGERASSHLEMHNEGSTAVFYSWQRLSVPRSFPNLRSQTKRPHFYFNSSSGVILPGDTQRVEFIFKSKEPCIKTELWQLNTHPVLLQGAHMRVTLKGVALSRDKTADQRLFIETKLEKKVTVKMCRSIVYKMLQGVQTPERPSSPAELYITEEQEFIRKNPKFQYLDQPVEDLKRLWQEVNPGQTWDLSVDTIQQAVRSLPEQQSAKENSLAQLNSLLLLFSEPPKLRLHLTATAIGQQLWRKLLDVMANEAMWLRNLLELPEKGAWSDEGDESVTSDADVADNKNEKSEKKGVAAAKEERSGVKSRVKDANKGELKTAENTEKTEDSRKKGKRKDDEGKGIVGKQGMEPASLPGVTDTYKRLLHKKVYALMEDLLDSMCDLMDELHEGAARDPTQNVNSALY